ncbi:MAG: phosphate ABC transporter permease subunit PstC [Devosia sp.]
MAVTTGETFGSAQGASSNQARRVVVQDRIFYYLTLASAIFVVVMLVGVMVSLVVGAWPALEKFGPSFIWTQRWSPVKEIFGALSPIYGTIITSVVAMIIGIPVSFGIAIFLTEICPDAIRRPIGVAIELLAGIPSIIYGLWGFFYLAPFMAQWVQPGLDATLGKIPIIGLIFTNSASGLNLFTAAVILAIMVLPFITSITRDVFQTVPTLLRESAYGMGMTTWEVVRHIVIPYCRVGLVGGVMLGLGRALGETMAVTFVIGNSHSISASLFAPATTISATIANEFSEATTGVYTSSLILLGLVLSIITFAVLGLAKWLLIRGDVK